MKNTIQLVLTIVVGIGLISCNKPDKFIDSTTNFTKNFLLQEEYDANGSITLIFDNYINAPDSVNETVRGRIGAGFLPDGNHVYGGDLKVNNHEIPFYSDLHTYETYFEFDTIDNIFGGLVTYSLAGSTDFPPFEHSFYLPSIINASTPDIYQDTFSKSSDMILNWNADANSDHVIIGMYYSAAISNRENPGMVFPDENISFYEVVEDNGSYTIGADRFQDFPEGGYIVLNIGRGYHREIEVGLEKVMISGITLASTLVVIDK